VPLRPRWLVVGGIFLVLCFLSGCSSLFQPNPPPNQPPIGVFSSRKVGEALTYLFDASPSYDPDGKIESYRWDFSDNTVEFGQVVRHTFPQEGTYTVQLTVTDDQGASGSSIQQVSIDFSEVFIAKTKNAIDYWDPVTRDFALGCIKREHSGSYNIAQICDIWDACTYHWVYANDPYGGVAFNPTPASQTVIAGLRGDCDDYAVLLAAAIKAIGGGTRVVIARKDNQGHAYAEVYIGTGDVQSIIDYIFSRYPGRQTCHWWVDSNGDQWLNLDWSASYPGGPYYEGERVLVIYPWPDGRAHPLQMPSG